MIWYDVVNKKRKEENIMNVILKNGKRKKYRLTLKMVGYSRRRWHYVEYSSILKALEHYYPELENNIERAYL